MSDANVAVSFAAIVGDLVAGIAEARDALASLAAPFGDLNGQYAALGASIGRDLRPDAAAALRRRADGLGGDRALARRRPRGSGAAMKTGRRRGARTRCARRKKPSTGEIKAERRRLDRSSRSTPTTRASIEITSSRKLASSRQALDEEYAAELAPLQQEAALGEQSLAQEAAHRRTDPRRRTTHQDQIDHAHAQALDEQAQQYQAFGNTITQAFNSQLRGLLSGTENWRTAFKNILEDLLIKFIEWSETTVVHHVGAEAAKTAATTAGVAARTGAEQAGAAASLAAQGAR